MELVRNICKIENDNRTVRPFGEKKPVTHNKSIFYLLLLYILLDIFKLKFIWAHTSGLLL